ncbi:hypothetical protein PENTCL1PPCAC_11567, partial [Pristionchus entomophagus]
DHVVLRLADLSDDPPIFITVRTRTREGAVSSDSNVARVPRAGLSSSLPYSGPLGSTVGQTRVVTPLAGVSLSATNPLSGQGNSVVPLHLPLQTLTNFQSNIHPGSLSDPLRVKESDPMASSYPSPFH